MKWPLVLLSNVKIKTVRGDFVFTDLNLTVEPGKAVIITGPPGSGKTSIAELILGVRQPAEGTVELFGETLKGRSRSQIRRFRRKIGGVGGPFGLVPTMTVAENIALPLVINGERVSSLKERLAKVMGEFNLLKLASQYPRTLTRVENTLAQIARATVAHQPLMIIDEPSAGLDRKTYLEICDYMVKVSVSGRSMLVLSSDPPPQKIPESRQFEIANGRLE
jgi:ABC-type ATPase involved in cell division